MQAPTYEQVTLGVGRILRSKAGEPVLHHTIKRRPDGTFRHALRRTIVPGTTANDRHD